MAHDFPSVFSFFLPEFVPSGRLAHSHLAAPEAGLLDMPTIVSTINGIFSLFKFGLSKCEGGFGEQTFGTCGEDADFTHGTASPHFSPGARSDDAAAVVDELATLLTAGRLSAGNRQIVTSAYETELHTVPAWIPGAQNSNGYAPCLNGAANSFDTLEEATAMCEADPNCGWLHDYNCDGNNWRVCGPKSSMIVGDGKACTRIKSGNATVEELAAFKDSQLPKALALAQQLVATTPEFHTNNVVTKNGEERHEMVTPPNNDKDYKAVVYLVFSCGCDSFQMLTPHTCTHGSTSGRAPEYDLYQQYVDVREQVALPLEELLSLNATGSRQACETFGLHPRLGKLAELYDAGDALFAANVGVMSKVQQFSYFICVYISAPL